MLGQALAGFSAGVLSQVMYRQMPALGYFNSAIGCAVPGLLFKNDTLITSAGTWAGFQAGMPKGAGGLW